MWEAESGECLLTLRGHSNWVTNCAWSPDGKRLLSGSQDATLKIWNAETGQELMTCVLGPDQQAAALDFRGRRVLSASPEVWRFLRWRALDPETGEVRLLPIDHFEPMGFTV